MQALGLNSKVGSEFKIRVDGLGLFKIQNLWMLQVVRKPRDPLQLHRAPDHSVGCRQLRRVGARRGSPEIFGHRSETEKRGRHP